MKDALKALGEGLCEMRVSSLYQTSPVSEIPQPDYFNLAVVGRTSLPPRELLAFLQRLERDAGRTRQGPRNGPRRLDIDLLLFDGRLSEDAVLTLPHPRMRSRRFVLEPLAQIAPDLPVPPDGATVAELLDRLPQEEIVRRVPWSSPPSVTANRPEYCS